MTPGDGGLFGGWALERDEEREAEEQNGRETEHGGPAEATVIQADLSRAAEAAGNSGERAAILRETARRLQSEMWDRPQYGDTSLIVIYGNLADLGMWMARSEKAASPWKIVLQADAETGSLIVRLLA